MNLSYFSKSTFGAFFAVITAIYSILFSVYFFFAVGYTFIYIMDEKVAFTGSDLEMSIIWFANHPVTFMVLLVIAIPGILVLTCKEK
ncbi:MAG: hypothetical protein WC564_03455 [Patescibacteria group bacterium]